MQGDKRHQVALDAAKAKLIGRRFHRLLVVSLAQARLKKHGGNLWNCRCDCGAKTVVSTGGIGTTKSCGCARVEAGKANFKDVSGHRYGLLTAIKTLGQNRFRSYVWECRCDCGNLWTGVFGSQKSCGCLRAKAAKDAWIDISNGDRPHPRFSHGMSKDPQYQKALQAKRRAWAEEAGGTYLPSHVELIYEHQDGKCSGCGGVFSLADLTHDHIRPLSAGGSNEASNIQLLCGSCNSSKRASDFMKWSIGKRGWSEQQYLHWVLARHQLNKRLRKLDADNGNNGQPSIRSNG